MVQSKAKPPKKVTGIDAVLEERGKSHGDFKVHSNVTQNMKRSMQASPNWDLLTDDKKEALEMVAHKIGRILAGDPNFQDHYTDIIGYTRLVEKDLE